VTGVQTCALPIYHNTAAASGCVISVPDNCAEGSGEKILLLERAKYPAKGKLDLPGGFVDPGEGLLESLLRELREEIGWPKNVSDKDFVRLFKMFASFSNVYPYKNISYNTCDVYFSLRAEGLRPEDLTLQNEEISAVFFLHPNEIDLHEIAFDSTRKAICRYRELFV
jgi:8-oxo-dGTP pyrophosphatase MutT (NUDIX family)